MKRKYIFLMIAIFGMCYTWFYNIQFFIENPDASFFSFFEIAESTLPGKSYGADLLIVVIAFFVFYIPDAIKLKIKNWWILIPLTFLIAIAFTFPLYLYLRESKLEKIKLTRA